MKSSATVVTRNANLYLSQLCRHFARRVPARYDAHEGRIVFSRGEVALRAAPETLMLVVSAPGLDDLTQVEQVTGGHLRRFAADEPDMDVDWRRGTVRTL